MGAWVRLTMRAWMICVVLSVIGITTGQPLEDTPEDDISKTVCMPMMFNQVITAEHQSRVKQFQKGWLDSKKFPAIKMSARQSAWMLGLSVDQSTRLSHGRQGQDVRINGLDGQKCYHIPGPMRLRKEYRQLTDSERQSLHNALISLKSFRPDPVENPDVSGYDLFVQMHRFQTATAAHGGAAFLPWHREFLLRMENALYEQGYTGPGLPYWDSTIDQNLPDPSQSALFSDDYMGNNDGFVTSGPAANWTTIQDCQNIGSTVHRSSRTGASGQNYLLSDEVIEQSVYTRKCFKDISCREGCDFENAHGGVHVFFAGHMSSVSCSPSDPMFFLHHCFIDAIWEEFRQNYQQTEREREYPSAVANNDNIGWSDGHEWDSPMNPFEGLINAQGISDHYTNYYYSYAERPNRCIANNQCQSDALWCDRRACRCRAKVRLGGYCGDLPHMACYGTCDSSGRRTPKCRDTVCVC